MARTQPPQEVQQEQETATEAGGKICFARLHAAQVTEGGLLTVTF
jgi:hypothetical protein